METLKLNDVFKNWVSDGIFKYLNALNVPWKNDISVNELNVIYHGARSGNKSIGSIIDNFIVNNELTEENKNTIALSLFAIYNKNWVALWNTLNLEYNPIENYSMTESENIGFNKKVTSTQDLSETTDISNNIVANTQDLGKLYGFNSTDGVNSNKQLGDTTTDTTQTGTNTTKENSTNNEDNTTERTLKRSGNIGVTTSQQMIESERNLWMWNFFENVFSDIDKILVLSIY